MRQYTILSLLALLSFRNLSAQQEARLLRFPAIHDNRIVFTYAGDLYTVASTGGVARKLTNSEGIEMFPRFSPDGKWIAFTGQYDGNTEVYVMPSEGGVPKRLTYTATLGRDDVSDRMGPNNIVMGWKHDNNHIIFGTNFFVGNNVNATTGRVFSVPMPAAGDTSCSLTGSAASLAPAMSERMVSPMLTSMTS